MKIRLDNILMCILWLLAVTLGTSFWFNTAFGFNIFSGEHWNYIASLQASHAPVKTGFYISMAVAIFAAIFGIYVIVRPRLRKFRMPIMRTKKPENSTSEKTNTTVADTVADKDASNIDMLPAENQPAQTQTPAQNAPQAPSASARPPRLVLPTLNSLQFNSPETESFVGGQSVQPRTTPQQNYNQTSSQSEDAWPELKEIFTSAGYTLKPNIKVDGMRTSVVAIGTNETIWLGCVGLKTTDVRNIIDRVQEVFFNTLDETEISINGFVIAAPDAATSEFEDILMFNSISELRDYMTQHPNPALPADDDGMFEAYSQYIDAVITHIGKF